ncbi:MAG: T9SS type A sorting domain-containing protein, partial [Flavobacteriales bacterium]|nr:T9SS type A sorting domain-containing protein [Flavobacteriales bacterium]MBP9081310.1 T9SS type A sorting domain-containing protein [Flavobacteriales bacterium]
DAQGRVVLEERIVGTSVAIDVSSVKRGMYLVRVASVDGVAVDRLVVE